MPVDVTEAHEALLFAWTDSEAAPLDRLLSSFAKPAAAFRTIESPSRQASPRSPSPITGNPLTTLVV